MPGFDGTGPRGMGPRTGGGFGNCKGSGKQGGNQGRFGRGAGQGNQPLGGGRGRCFGGGLGSGAYNGRNGWRGGWQEMQGRVSPENQIAELKEQAKNLERELSALKEEIRQAKTESTK